MDPTQVFIRPGCVLHAGLKPLTHTGALLIQFSAGFEFLSLT